ncbi:MAG: hypothetical protein PHZ26_00715 [Candidatus Gracilibacteria bacterium]|nr:hypothetical protein [Candidatus Gracilibacteria bacterium]MDD2908258.1 hypothetical protein [Candidatus Gracilibacteria bacterium]
MKKNLYYIVYLLGLISNKAFADNITGIADDKLKNGDVSFSDIPKSIQYATGFILKFAATIAVIAIIIGGLKYSLGSVEGSSPNKQKANDTIKYGIMGFVIAVSSWYIINLIVNNL